MEYYTHGETFSGDYAIINNSNQNTDKIIDNDNKLYDMLFTVESGEIRQILDDFTEQTGLNQFGELGVEEQILEILEDEPTDFIISWENIYLPNLKQNTPILLLSGDNINFSKLVRDNQAFNNAMTIARVIMGYTVIILMIHNIWTTLMLTLGIGVALYEDNEEEKQRMEVQTSETVNINGETGQFTRTVSTYDPRRKYRQNVHFKGK